MRNTLLRSTPHIRFFAPADDDLGGGGGSEPKEGKEGAEVEEPDEGDTEDEDDEDETPGGIDHEKLLAKVRKTNSENRALRARAKEAETKAQGADDATKRAAELESENLRLKVAIKHGIPEKLVSRLRGATEEELLTDAQGLMELFEAKKPPTRKPTEKTPSGGTRAGDSETQSLDELAAEMFRD